MKSILLSLLWTISVLNLWAKEPNYREDLRAAHDRLALLDTERHDYRKALPALSAEQEKEWVELRGRLLRDDPVWVLLEQLNADIRALHEVQTKSKGDAALMETLKNLLAEVAPFWERATSRAQADEYAKALRQFIVRRDESGLRAWSKSQR